MKIKPSKREVKSFRNKYLALTIISLLFFGISQAQYLKPNNSYGTISNRQSIDSTLLIPTGCGDPSLRGVDLKKVALYADTCNNLLYKYDPVTTTWSVIGSNTTLTDGRVSGGVVTWSGQGLKFYVSPATYILGGKYYYSALDSVTLAAAPTSNSRIDLIGVDTSRHAFVDTGVVSATPIVPQADIASQIALTTGILINAGDTIPSNVITKVIYDENLGAPNEWGTGTQGAAMSIDFGSTTNPKHGTKSTYISSFGNSSTFYFVTTNADTITADETLTAWIYLSSPYTSSLYVMFYDNTNGATAQIRLTSANGFNPNLVGQYQLITIPFYTLSWTNYSGKFNTVLFKLYGTSSVIQADYIQLQKGINSVPPQIDYSNKLDNVLLSNDSLFQYVKGVRTFKGLVTGTSGGIDSSAYSSAASVNDSTWSLNAKNGTKTFFQLTQGTTGIVGDTVKFTNPNFVKKSDKFPIGTIKPILALNDTTLAFDSLNLTEIRYSLAARDTTKWTDTTLIDRKFLDARINPVIASVNTNTTAIAGKQNTITLTTTGTSGAATLSGSTLNIPQYSGGGSVDTTSLSNRINNKQQNLGWVNVMDFGADSTGATDNSTAFANAIATLPARGGTLFIPRGQFLFTSTLTINKPIVIVGEGEGKNYGWYSTTRITCATNIDVWSITAAGVSISKAGFEWTGASNPTSARALYIANADTTTSPNMPDKTQKLTLRDFSVRGFYNNIYIDKCATWNFDNIVDVAAINYGLFIQNLTNQDSGDWSIANSMFFQPMATPGGYAIFQQGAGGGKIISTKFNGAWNYDIWTTLSNSVILLVSNCSFENFKAEAIHAISLAELNVHGCEFAPYSTITGNGYINAVSCTGGIISGNNFSGYSAGTAKAVYLNSSVGIVLTNNAYVSFTSNPAYTVSGSNTGGIIREQSAVTIGTGTPASQLYIVQDGSTNSASRGIYQDYFNTTTDENIFAMRRARGTVAAPAAVSVGDLLGIFSFVGYNGGFGSNKGYLGAVQTSSTGESLFLVSGNTSNNYVPNLFLYENGDAAIGPINSSVKANASIVAPSARWQIRSGSATTGNALLVQNSTPSDLFKITNTGSFNVWATNTAAGTTGAQTINTPSGTVNIAAGGTSVVVTNSLVTANSIVMAVIRTNDATAIIKNVVPSAGSFTINLNAATTAETSIGFWVIN